MFDANAESSRSLTFFSTDQRAELLVDTGAHLSDDLLLHLLDPVKVGNVVNVFAVRC